MPTWDKTQGRPEPIWALNKIKELENHEPLVDMLVACPSIRLHRAQVIPYIRKTVAEMCEEAAHRLPAGQYLGLVEAWRPLARQQRIYEFFLAAAKEAYPTRSYASLRRTICRWIAPTDQKAPPGHCTGAAVDVHLIDGEGNPIDVTSPHPAFKAAPTYTLGLSEQAQQNRDGLIRAMLGVGFSNCRDEWWHYSYGDAGWAVRLGETSCMYGLASLPLELYAELEIEHAEHMNERKNPFLPSVT